MYRFILFTLLFSNYTFADSLTEILPDVYTQANPTIERKAIVESIIHQFDLRRDKGISQADLDRVFNLSLSNYPYNLYRMRFQIVNQKLYASYLNEDWFPGIINFLQRLVKKYKINDADFIFWHCEKLMKEHEGVEDIFFLFSKSSSSAEKNKFLFPDFFMLSDWGELVKDIKIENTKWPWEQKLETIFWRGMTTASYSDLPEREPAYYDIDVIDKTPRFILVMQSQLYPEFVNARFSEGIRMYKDRIAVNDLEVIFNKLKLSEDKRTKEIEHIKYKYLISVDGNTAAWRRVPWIMASNSVLVKQETDLVEWFYPALKRYVNYVPVNKDLSDLFCQFKWMKDNDNKVKYISHKAQKFIIEELMPENIEAHAVITLNEYSKLHKGIKIVATLPTAEETLDLYYKNKKISHEKEVKTQSEVGEVLNQGKIDNHKSLFNRIKLKIISFLK